MKTYSETQGKPYIDWNQRLNRNPETITEKEWKQWEVDAGGWVTCACGNQCEVIPRDLEGRPEDQELRDLGMEFSDAIENRWTLWAKQILEQIEARSAYLIAEIEVNKKP